MNFKYQVPISMAQTYSEMTTSTVTEIFPRVAPTGRKDVPKDLFPKPRYLLQHDCLDRNALLGDTFSGDDWIPRPHPTLSDMYEHNAAQMVNARGALSVCAQSRPTLCNPIDGSPPGSSIHGIFQARMQEWVTISYSRGTSRPRDQTCVS